MTKECQLTEDPAETRVLSGETFIDGNKGFKIIPLKNKGGTRLVPSPNINIGSSFF